MRLYETKEYRLEMIIDKKIIFNLVSEKTGEILQKQFEPESLIKKIYASNILNDYNIFDMFV
jgi:hypothetical protein